jgi:ribose transport system substrate-binding protein
LGGKGNGLQGIKQLSAIFFMNIYNKRKWISLRGVFMFKIRNVMYISLGVLLLVSLSFSAYFVLKTLEFSPTLKETAASDRPDYHFVLISEEVGNPYWNRVKLGATDAGKKLNAVIEYKGPVQSSTELHVKAVEKAIAAKVDGIITQGLDQNLITPVINKAIQKGIPVITVDTDAPASRRSSYVGTNNYQAGYLAGKTLIEDLKGTAKVGIITGTFHSTNQRQRIKGFRHAVKNKTGIEIVATESSNISRIQAAEKAYKIFSEHNVTALFGTSALDGLGIAAAAQLLEKTVDVHILAFDALPETLKLIKEGTIDATIVQKPYQMGYKSVELMVDIMKGKNVPDVYHTKIRVLREVDLPFRPNLINTGSERP